MDTGNGVPRAGGEEKGAVIGLEGLKRKGSSLPCPTVLHTTPQEVFQGSCKARRPHSADAAVRQRFKAEQGIPVTLCPVCATSSHVLTLMLRHKILMALAVSPPSSA